MATPFTALTVDVPITVAPLETVSVTAAVLPVTVFPPASRMATTGCVVKAAPLAAPAAFVVSTTRVGAPTAPVALKVTGLPLSPVAVADTEFAPGVPPSVHDVSVAIPSALVFTTAGLAGAMLPPPLTTANVTLKPDTGVPCASVTSTRGGEATAAPAEAVCVSALLAEINAGGPAGNASVDDSTASAGSAVTKRSLCGPVPLIDRPVKLATPPAATAVVAPPSTPLPDTFTTCTGSVAPLPVVTSNPALSTM